MGSAFHQLCPRYSGTLTPTAPTAIRLWETFTVFLPSRGQLLKERICSSRSKFSPLRIDPISEYYLIQKSKQEFMKFNVKPCSDKQQGAFIRARVLIRIDMVTDQTAIHHITCTYPKLLKYCDT